MFTLDELASNETIKEEYKKTFLLNLFQKICVRMERDESLRENIQTLFRQTYDTCGTIRALFMRELKYELTEDEAEIVRPWILANLRKSNKRKPIPIELKQKLCREQNGKCRVCGESLGINLTEIHVDHIIPFALVGDELENNYQALCSTCNLCKSAHTDYIFKSLLKII